MQRKKNEFETRVWAEKRGAYGWDFDLDTVTNESEHVYIHFTLPPGESGSQAR